MPLRFLVVLVVVGNTAVAWNCGSRIVPSRKHWTPAATNPRGFSWKRDLAFSAWQTRSLLAKHEATDPSEDAYRLVLGRKLSTPETDVANLLHRMSSYFASMVDAEKSRFFLLSYPRSPSDPSHRGSVEEARSHVPCPLRDLGSAWDATKALRVLRAFGEDETGDGAARAAHATTTTTDGSCSCSTERSLEDAIVRTTDHYSSSLVPLECGRHALHLSPMILGEAPNIAHNALLLLALIASEEMGLSGNGDTDGEAGRASVIDGLARGILGRQRTDGAFRTGFPGTDGGGERDDVSRGIDFFPGEAMTALMELHRRSDESSRQRKNPLRDEISKAMLSALGFYCAYYEEGRNRNTIDASYSIWQIQAFARLVLALREEPQLPPNNTAASAKKATAYCLELCRDIVRSPAWKLLSRGKSFYPNLSTVEIACGLDALSWGVLVLDRAGDDDDDDIDIERLSFVFHGHIDEAVAFLKWSQDRVPADSMVGYGGLGHGGYCVTEQRLDVTGHALSAVANLVLPA